jgi:glycosyltransferase involved in cell wall biosynthesis
MENKNIRVLMVGADRSVHGGVSGVVNNYYAAGLDKIIDLKYIGTMVDGSKLRKLWQAVKAYTKFFYCVRKYDIVHINMASDSSYYRKMFFVYVAHMFNKKIVIHQHGGDFSTFYYKQCTKRQQDKIRKNLNYADKFIVLTNEWKEFFSDIVDKEKLIVLPNAISVPVEYAKDYDNINMLFLGRLCRDKGLYELFEATTNLKSKYPQLHLYLGGVWEDEILHKEMEKHTDCITWLGWIDGAKKDELLRKCSIYVLPSYYEGMPVSVLEGMAYGCVPVVTYVGGIKDMIEDEKDGIFVESKSVESLEKGLEKAIKTKEKRKEIGENARKKVIEKYEIQYNVRQLLSIYEEVLGSPI